MPLFITGSGLVLVGSGPALTGAAITNDPTAPETAMREKFFRTLLVALSSYAAAIPLIYVFIRKVYGLGDRFAYTCVAIAVLLTLPVLTVRAVRTYREIGEGPRSSGQAAPARALWLRTGLAMMGTIGAGAGMVIVGDGHRVVGTLVAVAGAVTVGGAARSIIGLTRPSSP